VTAVAFEVRRITADRADVAIGVVLLVISVAARWGYLAPDGLNHDDAWLFVGATKSELPEFLRSALNHPGFSLTIRAWAAVVTSRPELSALPALAVGCASPPILYLLLRRSGIGRAAALLSGALLAVSAAHVTYSSRVKPYVFDMLAIVVLAFLLPRLSRTRWRALTAVAWVAAAVVLGTFSVHLLLATAVAAALLVLHPAGDLPVRVTALAVQAAIQAGYFTWVQRSHPSEALKDFWEPFDTFVQLDSDPLDLLREVGTHFAQVGAVVIGDGDAGSLAVVVLALVGLAVTAWRGPRALVARYLLALIAVAFVGSVLGLIPFGGREPVFLVTYRLSVWLLGALLVGLAFAVDGALGWVHRRWAGTERPLTIAAAALAGVVVVLLIRDPPTQPPLGIRSAQQMIEQSYRDGDLLIVMPQGLFGYATEPAVDVDLNFRVFSLTGFGIEPVSPPSWSPATVASVPELAERVGGAERVVLHDGGYPFLGADVRQQLVLALEELGFAISDSLEFDYLRVDVWERRDVAAAPP
jgi:hypothetical protein